MGLFNKIANLFRRKTEPVEKVKIWDIILKEDKAVITGRHDPDNPIILKANGGVIDPYELLSKTGGNVESSKFRMPLYGDASFKLMPHWTTELTADDLRGMPLKKDEDFHPVPPLESVNPVLKTLSPIEPEKETVQNERDKLKEVRRKLTPQERGLKGAKARMNKLTPQRRSEIAKLASIAAHAKREREKAERK